MYTFLDWFLSYVLAFVELHQDLSLDKTGKIPPGGFRYHLYTFPVIVYMAQVSITN